MSSDTIGSARSDMKNKDCSSRFSLRGGGAVPFFNNKGSNGYVCSFDYNEYEYVVNETDRKELPKGVKKIEIVVK